MSRVPYLDRLGDAIDVAVRRHSPEPRRRRGWVIAVASFVVVLVAGSAWLVVRPFADSDSTATTDATTTSLPVTTSAAPTTSVAATTADLPSEPPPAVWGLVPSQPALAGGGRVVLSGVAAWDGGLVAVGSDITQNRAADGVVVSSSDGVAWVESARLGGISLSDVVSGPGGLAATGLEEADDPASGAPSAVIATSTDGRSWDVATLPVRPDAAFAMVNAVASFGGGFVAGGSEIEYPDGDSGAELAGPVIWLSPDGVSWERHSLPPTGSPEATVEDVTAADGMLVAVGLVADGLGASRPAVWTSPDGHRWTEGGVDHGDDGGFTGMSGVAAGEDGLVAVGFAPSTGGTTGAIWTSSDGAVWRRVADPDGILLGASNAATRIHGVTAFGGGYVAVGATLERPYGAHRIWTSDDGRVWRRFDLADPGSEWATSAAFDVTALPGAVVAVGMLSDLDATVGEGAVWIGPPPDGVPAGVPLEPGDEPVAGQTVMATIDPPVAVGATRVAVRGSLPDGGSGEPVEIWLVPADGAASLLCDAAVAGRGFSCRVVLGETGAGLTPGEYGVAVGDPGDVVPGVGLVVMPEGSRVVTLSAVYQATMWPLLQSVSLRNHGAEPVDVTGWTLADSGGSGQSFVFPDGSIIDPGSSFLLDFAGPGGGTCPEPTARYVHWCRVVGTGGRIDFGDGDLLWRGGDVEVRDATGTLVAVWTVPR